LPSRPLAAWPLVRAGQFCIRDAQCRQELTAMQRETQAAAQSGADQAPGLLAGELRRVTHIIKADRQKKGQGAPFQDAEFWQFVKSRRME
jgi:hypothetical protein